MAVHVDNQQNNWERNEQIIPKVWEADKNEKKKGKKEDQFKTNNKTG